MKKIFFSLALVAGAASVFFIGRKRIKQGLPLFPFIKTSSGNVIAPGTEYHPEILSNETALP